MTKKKLKIFVAGHKGMVGSSIVRNLKKKNINKVFTVDKIRVDLTDQKKVFNYLNKHKFDQIYIAAAKVGGIYANNTYPAEFIFNNLMIASNIIHGGFLAGTKKILFLGSSCIYPKYSKQPMHESELLNGYLEPTNEPYAIAKISGIKMCESYNRQYKNKKLDFRSLMPCNLFGLGDNYHKSNSHVIPALIRKIHEAKIKNKKYVEIWGSGKVRREFLFVDDLAEICVKYMNISSKKVKKFSDAMCSHINVGAGWDLTIEELAYRISKIINYDGKLYFNKNYPDGHPQKLLNVKKIKKLLKVKYTNFDDALFISYRDYLHKKLV